MVVLVIGRGPQMRPVHVGPRQIVTKFETYVKCSLHPLPCFEPICRHFDGRFYVRTPS
jgi:hypothetical protein